MDSTYKDPKKPHVLGTLYKIPALAIAVILACAMMFACKPSQTGLSDTAEQTDGQPAQVRPGEPLPRSETLYFAGLQNGRIIGWNPYSADMNNAIAVTEEPARQAVFETLYMYNLLDGSMYPLLAEGAYKWNDDRTRMTVKINPDAKWSDGTPVTAEDVAYTYASHLKYETNRGIEFRDYIEKIEAADAETCVIYAKLDADGSPVNPLQVVMYLGKCYVIQKAFTEKLEARSGSTANAFKKDPCPDFIASGPYKSFYEDAQKVVLIRDDNYWGQAPSMWGRLPAPKYICHNIFESSEASQAAFENGEADVLQQFIPNIQYLWLKKGLAISTYTDKPPYGVCTAIPTAWYNMKSYGLDQAAVRKAIAMAVDYDAINEKAMTGQSPSFRDVPRSIMNPTKGEQALYDHDAVKDLQWSGSDIEGAERLLEEAGITDTDGDSYREYNGKNLEYEACCPKGWTDWEAAMEIVASSGQKIGINIKTCFPDWDVYQTVFSDGSQNDYDIFMWPGDGASALQPWARLRQFMSSEFAGMENNMAGNFGGYVNERADEIIDAIPKETDPTALKALYTEAVNIYLTDVPSFALMYRPELFHAVNESVWTGFPRQGDGSSIPPTNLLSGYGIAGLYDLKLADK